MSDAFAQADQANRLNGVVRFGVIAAVQPGPPTLASVEFEEGWVSDMLPVIQWGAGRVRSWSAPVVGEQVAVLSPSGEATVGAVLRGLNCDVFAEPSAEVDMTVLASWDDGAADTYDEATKTRAIAIPAGGQLILTVGALAIRIEDGGITLDAGGQPVTVAAETIALDGKVRLGGEGGKAVARHGDSVVGGKIVATTTQVEAA